MALALEEAGITRYGTSRSLFKNPPIANYKVNGENAKYIMITGDKDLSPRTESELAAATSSNLSGLPIIHFHGGEVTENSYDDYFRHSITKLSSFSIISNLLFLASKIFLLICSLLSEYL